MSERVVAESRLSRWHPCALRVDQGPPPGATSVHWTGDTVRLDAHDRFSVLVRARPLGAVVISPLLMSPREVVHPVMAFVGAVAAAWTGRSALHAAAVVVGGRAWLLVGRPGSGKSTFAVHARRRGLPVLCDDLAVVEGRTVFTGPRTADLREESARHWHLGDDALVHVVQPRWRQDLGPGPMEAELGGLVELRWGPELGVARLGASERIALLSEHDALGRGPGSPTGFLDLVQLPAFSLTRPRDLSGLDCAVDALLALVGSSD